MPSTCVSEAKAVPAPVISARRNKDSFFLIVKSLNSCRAQLLMVDIRVVIVYIPSFRVIMMSML